MIHPMRVLVTGASGRVGRAVVDSLIAAGVPVRALTRRPEATALPANVEVVTGDSPCLAAPARRVVFLSSPHQTPHPFFQQPNPMAVLHADIERLIAATGLESTIIRPGMFASNTLFWWAPAIRADGVVRWPYGAAETAPVDDRDVAAVAARTLYEDGHAGGDYVLTGPESLSQAEQVGIIGDVTGRRIRFEELTPDEFRSETAGTWPRPVVDMLLDAWGAAMGRPAYVTATVSDILGSARPFRQWVADHATAFTEGAGLGLGGRPVFDDETGEVVPMATSRQWVVDTLRHLGFTQAAEDALRDLPEEIDAEQLREFGDRHGIGSNMLTDRMGGSP